MNTYAVRSSAGARTVLVALVGNLALAACGAAPSQPGAAQVAPTVPPTAPPTVPPTVHPSGHPAGSSMRPEAGSCPTEVDVKGLLKRHAEAYGDERGVAALMPRVVYADVEISHAQGKFIQVTDGDRTRAEVNAPGLTAAAGIDEQGAWALGVAGVVHRVAREEAVSIRFDAWVAGRHYLHDLANSQTAVRCEVVDGAARVSVATAREDLGTPQLLFDLASGQLLAADHQTAQGLRPPTVFAEWSALEAGVRFPLEWVDRTLAQGLMRVRVRSAQNHITCDSGCTAPPPDPFTLGWPASGRVIVPMVRSDGQLSLRAKVGGRETWALLDSGAGLSLVDSTTKLGAAFHAAIGMTADAATQVVQLGVGELHDVTVGAFRVPRLPTASVPIPSLDEMGLRRPELILGYSFFAAAAVRVDYSNNLLVFAKDGDGLHSSSATSVPLHFWDGAPVAEFEVDGAKGAILIDTGNSGGLTLAKTWTSAHALPGKARTQTVHYRTGAGTEESDVMLWRAHKVKLGPIVVEDRVVEISQPPTHPTIAGLLGNEVLSRCAAVVFDVPKRTLWFEGPCNRDVPEQLAGWHLERKDDPAQPGRPWIVGKMVPEGPATHAGLLLGDRLIAVGGKPAILDRATFASLLAQPVGTRVKVDYIRSGTKLSTTLELARILSN